MLMWSSSVGMMTFPIYGKPENSCSKPPTSIQLQDKRSILKKNGKSDEILGNPIVILMYVGN